MMIHITSRENKIFKLLSSLRERRGREEKGLFVTEGLRSVQDAVSKGASIAFLVFSENFDGEKNYDIDGYILAPKLFREISDTVNPQGIMAVCNIPKTGLGDIRQSKTGCVVMCENVRDPGNIGTIIRTAHAAFCDGVVLSKGCCDLYNSKIVRSTMSGIFSIPVVANEESEKIIEYFRKSGYKITAGALSENSQALYSSSLCGKHLIIIGNEANGVSEKILSLCDNIVKIPMKPDAESLNAAVAGAVLMYEHLRQNI